MTNYTNLLGHTILKVVGRGDIIQQRRKKLLILGFICVIIMMISGTYAVGSGVSENNVFSTGSVDIEIKQYTLNESSEEISYENQYTNLMPDQEIDFIEKIKNKAANCYVRAKINLVDGDGHNLELHIEEMPEEWQKIGEYYYYKTAVHTGNEITIFKKIKIPDSLQSMSNKVILEVIVEAVQEEGFYPTYEVENPWGNIEIQKCIRNNYAIDSDTNQTIIQYENNADNYVKVSGDFTKALEKMMPGEKRQKEIIIENDNRVPAEIFLGVEKINLTIEQEELLKRTTVKITKSNGEELYDGNLLNLNNLNLGKYNKRDYEKIILNIQIPKDLKNEYEAINPSIIWKFSAKHENEKENRENKSKKQNPKTGDFNFDMSLIIFFTATLGLIVVLVLMRVEKNNIKK